MKKKYIFLFSLIILLVLIFLGISIFALEGSGTDGDPYLIHNWTELNQVRNDLSASYKLVGNLTFTDSDYSTFNSGNGWNPIGNNTNPFTGTFDGNGNTISYLYINRIFTNYIGLFGYISSSSTITNVSLISEDVSGYYAVGGLVGYNDGGIIKCSFTSGNISGQTTNIAGLVGLNFGDISDCYSTASIGGNYYSAGLVGYNDGNITNSYSTGLVTGESGYIRGMISSQGGNAFVNNSYYNNQTSGHNGNTYGSLQRNTSQMISNPYDSNTYLSWSSSIWQSNTNIIYDHLGNNGYPALIFQTSSDIIHPKYSNAQVNNSKISIPTLFSIDIEDNFPLNSSGYYIFSTNNSGSWVNDSLVNFTSLFHQTINVTKTLNSNPQTIGYIWYIYDSNGNFVNFSGSITTYSQLGSGTEDDPYLITTWSELNNIRNGLSSYYKLANNLSSSTSDYSIYNSGEGFVPIGSLSSPFTGVLDGDGYVIHDLLMFNNSRSYVALFGYSYDPLIVNLGLEDVNISGQDYVGALIDRVQSSNAKVYNSYVTGYINGTNFVGGICGHCSGVSIYNSYANVNVTGVDDIGGIGGYSLSNLLNSYSKGSVTGETELGGLVGATQGTIVNSYSTSNITNTTSHILTLGGLVGTGVFGSPILISSLWDENTTGQIEDVIQPSGGRNTSQMKDLNTYQIPTDMTNITNGYFETGNLAGWISGGNISWGANDSFFEGSYSAKSGDINDSQVSWINQSITISSNVYLNYWWKVSSENEYDYLSFCFNNPSCTRTAGYTSRISGGNAYWEMKEQNLSPGTYIIHWLYAKDSSSSGGQDSGWIDNIFITNYSIDGLDQSWDFINIWDINSSINDGYPFLNFRGIDVTLVSPANGTSFQNFNQTFNCSATSIYNLKNVTFNIYYSNGSILNSNKTIVDSSLNSTLFYYTLPNDGTYLWNCEYSDVNYNRASANTNNTIFISSVAPAINLHSPSNNKYLNYQTVDFNFSAFDSDDVNVCQVWSNFTGTWNLNYTLSSQTNGVIYNHTVKLLEGGYIWNVFCNDTYNNGQFSPNNFTITIDTTNPSFGNITITTTAGSQTISFNSSASDINLNTCKYSIYSNGSLDVINTIPTENISISCNSNPHTATVSSYGNYTLRKYAMDLAGNENYTELNFTTSPSSGTTITGGGGGTTIIIGGEKGWVIRASEDVQKYEILMIPGSSRKLEVELVNIGEEDKTITFSCEDLNSGEICPFITFSTQEIVLPALKDNLTRTDFAISLPDEFNEGDYVFNIVGTDELGLSGSVTVYLSVKKGGITEILTKFFLRTEGGFPYFLIFLITIFIFGFISIRVIPKEVPIKPIWVFFISFGVGFFAVYVF